MSLETRVARYRHQSACVEALMHGRGEWTADFLGEILPVTRKITDRGITLSITVPDGVSGEGSVFFALDGEMRFSRHLWIPEGGEHQVRWEFNLDIVVAS